MALLVFKYRSDNILTLLLCQYSSETNTRVVHQAASAKLRNRGDKGSSYLAIASGQFTGITELAQLY